MRTYQGPRRVQIRHCRVHVPSQGLVPNQEAWDLNRPDLVFLDLDRSCVPLVLRVLARISGNSRCRDWGGHALLRVAKLSDHQLGQYFRTRAGGFHVQLEVSWKTIHHGKSTQFDKILQSWACSHSSQVIGALITMAFFFAYTAVRTPSQNLGKSRCGMCYEDEADLTQDLHAQSTSLSISTMVACTHTRLKFCLRLIARLAMELPLGAIESWVLSRLSWLHMPTRRRAHRSTCVQPCILEW